MPILRPASTARAAFAIMVLTLALLHGASGAQALEITAEQRSACMSDAFRLCSSEIPNQDRVLQCMRVKKADLSTRCQAVLP